MNSLTMLNALGHSIWYDNIERKMLGRHAQLEQLIFEDDLRGVTSNPAIYEKAISASNDYDHDIIAYKRQGLSNREIFFELAITDIQHACDAFQETYEKTSALDGYVSLEVSPDLARNVKGTVEEAVILWQKINRKNAMIKVPATLEGLDAIEILIGKGINVNVTLIFSVERYRQVAEAYIKGLHSRIAAGLPTEKIASVASFFVSRIDSRIDPLVADKMPELAGKIAIANAQKAYLIYLDKFENNPEFASLAAKGSVPQRLLWASTGVKNPAYSGTYYIDALASENSVNTVPPATYQMYKDHGKPKLSIREGIEHIDYYFRALDAQKISLDTICNELEAEGIAQFEQAFHSLLSVIEQK